MRATRADLVNKLTELSVRDGFPITDTTEIYYDLRISGGDMDEFTGWLEKHSGRPLPAVVVCPGEPGDFFGAVERWLGIRRYPSFTVADCLQYLTAA